MVKLYIELGRRGWYITIWYGFDTEHIPLFIEELNNLNCPRDYIKESIRIMSTGLNTGMTFSNSKYRTSFVCIGDAESEELFVNTVIHEIKHVQSHICEYYNIKEDTEKAAYLIGYIAQRIYKVLSKIYIDG